MATFTGIGAAFGSFFGANDLQNRFEEAIVELQRFAGESRTSLQGFRDKGNRSFDRGMSELSNPTMAPDVAALRQMLVTEIQSGLSPFAQLQLEDLNRQLEGRSVATGNLRSGAIGLQRAELGRRVLADEFSRALQTLDTIQTRDLNATNMFLTNALGFGDRENQALATLGSAISGVAGAKVGQGAVEMQRSVALGSGFGGLFDKAEEYFKVGGTKFTG